MRRWAPRERLAQAVIEGHVTLRSRNCCTWEHVQIDCRNVLLTGSPHGTEAKRHAEE